MADEVIPRRVTPLAMSAAIIALTQFSMIALAPALADEATAPALLILLYVALAVLGGAAWFAAIGPLERVPMRPLALLGFFGFGLAIRLPWFTTPPVLDTDALRYLWDGALATHGISPWAAPPAAGLPSELGAAGAALLDRLPFTELRSIYPATAQAAFLLAHWIMPWDVTGLRLVILGAELVTLPLLAAALHQAGLPVMRLAIWWCCPLLPLVLTNAAHVDALLPPLLLGAVLLTLRGKGIAVGVLLGLAAGVKLWPVLLAPLFGRWLPRSAWLGALIAFGATTLLVLAPLLATIAAPDAGLNAYARFWSVNNAPMAWAEAIRGEDSGTILRPLLGLAGAVIALAMACRAPTDGRALLRGVLVIAAATFYLSPAQFPWYAVWFLPLAAVLGCRALLLPAVLLPIYYLFFAFTGPVLRPVFAQGIAAIHLAGVLVMLGQNLIRRRARP
jgi:alpha-1,6-mannosyltransferase